MVLVISISYIQKKKINMKCIPSCTISTYINLFISVDIDLDKFRFILSRLVFFINIVVGTVAVEDQRTN